MKVGVCFTPNSFNFNLSQMDLVSSLKAVSNLIEKMDKGFVTFLKSNDFDEHAATEVYKQVDSLDAGAIMSLLYDQQMNKASTIPRNEPEVNTIVNAASPVYNSLWLSLYSYDIQKTLTTAANRTIHSEKSLVHYCSEVLVNITRSHNEYAEAFIQIYQNLLFLDNPQNSSNKTFDSIRKIEGGYTCFIKGITECLSYMNSYEIIPHDSHRNIANLNASLTFALTPEGTGKNKRQLKALKRDFLINGIEYKNVNCEYHYKLERIDGANGNGTYFYNRIYFGFFNRIDEEAPQIAIAHIGEHL
ncbi:hypothetical protein Q4489_16570 [Thalassotalea sp. 1_MG-2023]|uniref:hypothetical protein n=1 Tax=Thalassotalea sp. 1_MG-2023 TaxID=3062680 RepID=UPI0026E3A5F8|nr:hypothetical protein [Thalassotalea sp. 1_MG-2023]MDO6428628.1 hypothetical protein [Thalassotalea sp. 1_MG-2023]